MDRGVGTNRRWATAALARSRCLERCFADPLPFDEAFDPLTRG
jgi:hypothetical protein